MYDSSAHLGLGAVNFQVHRGPEACCRSGVGAALLSERFGGVGDLAERVVGLPLGHFGQLRGLVRELVPQFQARRARLEARRSGLEALRDSGPPQGGHVVRHDASCLRSADMYC